MASGGEAVCVDEAANRGVVITGLYIVKVGVRIIVISSVAQGVERAEVVGRQVVDAQNLAVGVVGVGQRRAAAVIIIYVGDSFKVVIAVADGISVAVGELCQDAVVAAVGVARRLAARVRLRVEEVAVIRIPDNLRFWRRVLFRAGSSPSRGE